ncbi:CAP domain-containing protein [Lutibacter sp. HS1-25]|uniref:CAP domain-containing protein n=1 Tax=Lutibacter sp. HS1-25 TaxID=2485000 RepID=UPI00101362E5|nr:CAP domain-containing protein [Lutibacter sp. HS1-25]RXP55793.1 CAP domain-containing protein [Lutibacter sp. HS1-25]
MKTLQINLVLVLLVCLFITSCSSEEDGIYFKQHVEVAVEYSDIELEILDLVNDYRVSKGLGALDKMNIISDVAETHTNYMAKTGKVCHDNFSERHQKLVSNANAKIVGENVGYGFTTAEGVVNAWLKSDSHRELIEKPAYTHFGISTEKNIEGRNYFTQIFIER